VIARPASWSEHRPDLRGAVVAGVVGVVLFLVCFGLLNVGPLGDGQIVDTPVYQQYGDAILDGQVPYRDFELEYPPAALPMFVLPSLAAPDDYATVFKLVVAACGALAVVLAVVTLSAVGASSGRMLGAAVFVGLAPLALGSVVLTRFDLWPALLTIAALAALASDRDRLGAGALGLATAAKLYPAVLLPIVLLHVARRRGTREAVICLGVYVAVLAVVLVPFAVLSPDGFAASFERQTGRPLQIESLGSALVLAAHQLGLGQSVVVNSYGSQNLAGSGPDALATAQTVLQILAVVGVWLLFALRAGPKEKLLAGSAAAVAAFVAFGKVLSPQYLIWLVPLVPLVAGGFGAAASALLLLTLVLTHLWFPSRYWDLVAGDGGPTWLLLVRDLALVALVAVLCLAIRRGSARPHTA
jgi:Glycosyltransferase family 87